jgi:hypothetical protein
MKVCTITKYDVRTNKTGKMKCIGNFYEKTFIRLFCTTPAASSICPERLSSKIRIKHAALIQNQKSFIGKLLRSLLNIDLTLTASETVNLAHANSIIANLEKAQNSSCYRRNPTLYDNYISNWELYIKTTRNA